MGNLRLARSAEKNYSSKWSHYYHWKAIHPERRRIHQFHVTLSFIHELYTTTKHTRSRVWKRRLHLGVCLLSFPRSAMCKLSNYYFAERRRPLGFRSDLTFFTRALSSIGLMIFPILVIIFLLVSSLNARGVLNMLPTGCFSTVCGIEKK